MKLLLIEDEKTLSGLIKKGLEKKGFYVDQAFDGDQALYLFEVNLYDLIILDLNLPFIKGLDLLDHIRAQDQEIKVLILSALDSTESIVSGLDQGANDYMTKPFDFLVLEAKVRSLLRRNFYQEASQLQLANLRIDTSKKQVFVGSKKLNLTNKEYGILNYLGFSQARLVSSQELMEHVWDSSVDLFSNSLKYHIYSLRKKLRQAGSQVEIKNQPSQGYILEEGMG